jgi:hypothetical protein
VRHIEISKISCLIPIGAVASDLKKKRKKEKETLGAERNVYGEDEKMYGAEGAAGCLVC